MGLLGVGVSLALRRPDRFESDILHQVLLRVGSVADHGSHKPTTLVQFEDPLPILMNMENGQDGNAVGC